MNPQAFLGIFGVVGLICVFIGIWFANMLIVTVGMGLLGLVFGLARQKK